MTEFLTVPGGSLAYEISGTSGPLVLLAHGIGHGREAYRFIAPQLADTGYRVVSVDLRGCGESSAKWPSYSRTDIASDLLAVVGHLGGPAVLIGHSVSGGAATIAAAEAPDLISAIVELASFTRKQSIRLADLRVSRFRTGTLRLLGTVLFGSLSWWHRYLDIATPSRKPADWTEWLAQIDTMLGESGRMKAFQKMAKSAPVDAGAQLANVRCPALIIEGSLDPDWADPRQEGEAIVDALPAGLGRLEVIEGAGHYPHVEFPEKVVALVAAFLESNPRA